MHFFITLDDNVGRKRDVTISASSSKVKFPKIGTFEYIRFMSAALTSSLKYCYHD